jgi:hypothetical protein
MLNRNHPFAPAGATDPWPRDGPVRRCATGASLPTSLILPRGGDSGPEPVGVVWERGGRRGA